MTPTTGFDRTRLKLIYEWDAERYLKSLPLEHFMEATAQATQRKITVESFDLIQDSRPDVQCFSELLVQYTLPGEDLDKPIRVVPDNMVVIHPDPLGELSSYMLPLQPVGPFFVLEYVSKGNERKDYTESYRKYERELKVPYYLIFYPDNDEVTLFHLVGEKYVTVTPNLAGRLPIPELELEAALLDGWVRFWFRGELQPLPADLRRERDAERTARLAAEQRADAERQSRLAVEAEVARLREELAKGGSNPPGG